MPLFDRYLIVDWSAASTPKFGKDSIWACLCGAGIDMQVINIPTRSEAIAFVSSQIESALRVGARLLAGFDFGFGYPKGSFAPSAKSQVWESVWGMIHGGIRDNDRNQSNRFEYASYLNVRFFGGVDGPFWGHPHQHESRYSYLGSRKPVYETVSEKRIVEGVVPSAQPVWKLAYTGSVGSQTLLGIARLQSLRMRFSKHLSIWPFETGFVRDLAKPVTIAEVYPSIIPVVPDDGEVKDAAQVRKMANWFQDLDRTNDLKELMDAPAFLSNEQRETVLREEGWIVGAGHHAV